VTAPRLPTLAFLALVAANAANVALRATAREPFATPPYVTFIEPTRAVLVRNAGEAIEVAAVEIDGVTRTAELVAQTGSDKVRRYEVRLGGLAPATEYRWAFAERVAKTGAPRRFEGRFRTASLAGPVRFCVLGDGGKSRLGEPWQARGKQFEIAERILAEKPDFTLYVGDIVYQDGRGDEYPEGFFRPFRGVLDAGIPVFPALGNHDAKTEYAEPYFDAFAVPRDGPGGGYYYSFDWGEVHVAVLDTATRRLERDPAQTAWLERDLRASAKPWKIVAAHHPPYQDHEETRLDTILPPILARCGAAAYIAGHYHLYERIEPGDGVLYLTSGGGGRSIHDRHSPSPHSKVLVPRYHFLRASADARRLAFEAVALEGDVFDRVELTR
jgi:hypothetical protein